LLWIGVKLAVYEHTDQSVSKNNFLLCVSQIRPN